MIVPCDCVDDILEGFMDNFFIWVIREDSHTTSYYLSHIEKILYLMDRAIEVVR